MNTHDDAQMDGVAPVIPAEVQQAAKRLVLDGVRALREDAQRIREEAAAIEQHREEVKRRIKRGARRTTGRIA